MSTAVHESNFTSELEELVGWGDAIKRGDIEPESYVVWTPPETIDVASIRHEQRLSQERFALKYGFTLSAVKKWDLGLRTPAAPIRTLLWLIQTHRAVIDGLFATAK